MNCANYLMLSPQEKIEMVGKIVHAVQSSNEIFNQASLLINKAERLGLFTGVIINPITEIKNETE